MSLKTKIDISKLPTHIAIIMDGNGRWAKEQNKDRLFGHYHGVESVRNIVEGCAELGVGFLTLYAFSTENWDRPVNEVKGLMELLVETIRQEVPTLNKNNIKLNVIGNLQLLPEGAKKEMEAAVKETASNSGLTLVMALSYSGRWEIINAVREIANQINGGKIAVEEINEQLFEQHLCTANIPDPELMIRTSGEHRISNFLLYQAAYTELYFSNTLWPDYRKEDLYEAIIDFQSRERRFGKTGEQVKNHLI